MDEPIYFYTKSGPFFELSNFAPFGFEENGVYWPTVEHYFQAHKFDDATYRERIRKCSSPKAARALGQTRSVLIRSDWDIVRDEVMMKALLLKFQRPGLVSLLLATNPRRIVEASPFDYYWGAGQDGSGQYRVGQLLEAVRAKLVALQKLTSRAQ